MSADLTPFLDEAQLFWRDTVHRVLSTECSPDYIRECDEKKRLPTDVLDVMVREGWFAVTLPEEYDGIGSYLEMAGLVEMIGYHSVALARFWNINVNMVGGAIAAFAAPALKEKLLPELARGETRFAFALSENEAGSDASAVRTKGIVEGDTVRVTGTKMWITAAQEADYILTAVRTDPQSSRHDGISLFLIPATAPGVTVTPIDMLGGHAVRTCEVNLIDVQVPFDLMIGDLHGGWKQLMRVLAKERVSLAAMCVGAAQAAVDLAVDYVTQRQQFGRAITAFQAVSHTLADMQTRTDAARMLAYRAAHLLASGHPCARESSQAKYFASDAYMHTAVDGVQMMGANGYASEYAMQRHFREAKLFQIFGGTNEIQRGIVAREMWREH
jgi:alkylation response protein AidB-like acyl-CoA dehydrogenase